MLAEKIDLLLEHHRAVNDEKVGQATGWSGDDEHVDRLGRHDNPVPGMSTVASAL